MTALEELEVEFKQLESGDYSATERIFDTIAVNYTRMAYDENGRPLFKRIFQWAQEHKEELPEFYGNSLLIQGTLEFLQDHFEISEKFLVQARDFFTAQGNEEGLAATSVATGFLHRTTGELDLAMKNGLSGMERLKGSDKYKIYQIIGSYWLGSVYTETGHLDEALQLYQDALKIDYPRGVEALSARLTSGIGNVYLRQKRYDLALEYLNKALDQTNERTEKTFRARGLTDIADYYLEMGDYEKAILFNKEALEMRRDMKLQNACITNMMNLGTIYSRQGKFAEAIDELKQALEIAEEIKVKVKIFPIHLLLSEIYMQRGNIEKGHSHFRSFHEIKEAVNHEDLERKVKNQVQLFQALQVVKENEIIKAQKIEIEKEKKRSDELLYNILPEEVADELKSKGNADARLFDDVTVLFTDFKDFTGITENMSPKELVEEIHTCFKAFDEIIEKYGIEKIKTIGDSYMCAAGLPVINRTHAEDIVNAGLEIRDFVENHKKERLALGKKPFEVRIGIHTGPVVAGIVGIRKFAYDIWGDTVNTASRMESSGQEGKVNISEATYNIIKDKYNCTPRGKIVAKNKGEMEMYFVEPLN